MANEYDEYQKRMDEIREQFNKADKLAVECNSHFVSAISEAFRLLEKYKVYEHGREYRVLSKDINQIKNEFEKGCICKKK